MSWFKYVIELTVHTHTMVDYNGWQRKSLREKSRANQVHCNSLLMPSCDEDLLKEPSASLKTFGDCIFATNFLWRSIKSSLNFTVLELMLLTVYDGFCIRSWYSNNKKDCHTLAFMKHEICSNCRDSGPRTSQDIAWK